MSCILHIDTSTSVCSVAVSQDGTCLFNKEDHSGPNHSITLGIFIDEALALVDSQGIMLDAVSVSGGPGSYTGLRIGVSMAKGICYGRDLKLISVPTLELLCVPVLLNHDEIEDNALLCPMIDARRMEVYAALFDRALKPIRDTRADVVDENTYKQWLDERPVYFFGNGAAKCMEQINHPNARLIEDIEPLAKWMLPLAEKRMIQERFEDVAYYTPFYLKDFVAKEAKKLI
ncbi:MAG: tRNA (adenosine(37)-N6)-threonylcarbamoyltransferase complex dimerization subunit type 1 TsaB [Prevotella sp.]|nr:tRNA (adenosine(37)-N6)-threonylcarbamoyltransferase complex dimerization subunit type 1 TsaB [Prevotella sp.]MBR2034751.1 tRNA (adenosine(37)-N6)-threonylcarbamoyltransferase complex dimerization subunit type 1 TsaB [Prevotella sp.]MBR2881103.1 tRNA (adenosine(37)-N6)-threonylcarbamoyltransferase complex dimerization subunit type 1 TsaB [Prevotella sp.]MBR6591610.1 tRNA (adenosine(37)-N6)-threonylcarbamoyltransferase complex dimerization subunit type 1 TsaB [Prevotella sp.]MBR7171991.1 tRNA